MSAGFSVWVTLYHRMQRNAMVLENYLELKQQELLKLCLTNFRINALKGRAEKHLKSKLQTKVVFLFIELSFACWFVEKCSFAMLHIYLFVCVYYFIFTSLR